MSRGASAAKLPHVKPDIAMLAEGVRPANLEKVFDANYGHFTSREGLMPVLYGGRLLKYIIEPGMGKEGVLSFRRMFEKEFGAIPKGGLLVNFTENHDSTSSIGLSAGKLATWSDCGRAWRLLL